MTRIEKLRARERATDVLPPARWLAASARLAAASASAVSAATRWLSRAIARRPDRGAVRGPRPLSSRAPRSRRFENRSARHRLSAIASAPRRIEDLRRPVEPVAVRRDPAGDRLQRVMKAADRGDRRVAVQESYAEGQHEGDNRPDEQPRLAAVGPDRRGTTTPRGRPAPRVDMSRARWR